MNTVAVECQDLTKTFGAFTALDGLTFTVLQGAITGFLGPNGSGKTTTLRILTGVASPTSGSAFLFGRPVGRDDLALRRSFGFLPEEPAFYGWMTAAETLDFMGEISGLKGPAVSQRRKELLEQVGLARDARRRVGGFSRGMRQRLGLAQALLLRPPLLLLDEPSSALDPAGRREVLDLISQLRGVSTVFLSTHILSDVERVCDNVVVIAKGKTVAQSSVHDLRERVAPPVAEVEMEEDPAPLLRALANQPWVQRCEVSVTGDVRIVRIWPMPGAESRKALPQAVAQAGLSPRRYEWMTPDLEQAFLEITATKEGA